MGLKPMSQKSLDQSQLLQNLELEKRGGGEGTETTANITQGMMSFTESVSDGVGVRLGTGVEVRVLGLDSIGARVSVTITGW